MDFFGRLHPLIVHLPIGFLIIGLILYWWQAIDRSKNFNAALKPIFLLGAIAAVISCITGLMLAGQGEYDGTVINRHRNTGIALAVVSIYFWYLVQKEASGKKTNYLSYSIIILLVVAGHYGASLTHGSGFLFTSAESITHIAPIPNVQEASAYTDVISPILHQKCVSCHGPDKQKGKLRLDSEEFIKKGGKNGEVIKRKDNAELLNRILLPPDDDDHMPPKEKGQLSKDQVQLIKWWIQTGANFQAKVKDLPQDETIKPSLLKLQGEQSASEEVQLVELPKVDAAPAQTIANLKKEGVLIVPLEAESNLLQLNLINLTQVQQATWDSLSKLSAQIWTLKADQKYVDNSAMASIGKMKILRKLSLVGANIEDSALGHISKLTELQSLNLSGTCVTAAGLDQLKLLKKLRYIYLFDTQTDSSHLPALKQEFPAVQFEIGKYHVPIFKSDTSIVKVKQAK